MADVPEAFKRHTDGPHLSTAEVRRALELGVFGVTFVDLVAPAHHLTDIYRRRARQLERQDSPQAHELARDIVSFCHAVETLENGAEVAATAIALEDGNVIIIWETMPTRKLLGVFSVPDERMLAD